MKKAAKKVVKKKKPISKANSRKRVVKPKSLQKQDNVDLLEEEFVETSMDNEIGEGLEVESDYDEDEVS